MDALKMNIGAGMFVLLLLPVFCTVGSIVDVTQCIIDYFSVAGKRSTAWLIYI